MKNAPKIAKTLLMILPLVFTSLYGCTAGFYQYPRTVEKGKIQLGVGTFVSITEVISSYSLLSYPPSEYNQSRLSIVGYPDIFLRYGISDNTDTGVRIWLPLGFISDIKWQFIGDRESKIAASLDFDFGVNYVFYPVNYYSPVVPGIILTASLAPFMDILIVNDFSIYIGLRIRSSYIPVVITYMEYPFQIFPLEINAIGTIGISLMNSYNYNILLEMNIMKSLFYLEKWAFSPAIGIKIKF